MPQWSVGGVLISLMLAIEPVCETTESATHGKCNATLPSCRASLPLGRKPNYMTYYFVTKV